MYWKKQLPLVAVNPNLILLEIISPFLSFLIYSFLSVFSSSLFLYSNLLPFESGSSPYEIRTLGPSSGSPVTTPKEAAPKLWSWFPNHSFATFHPTIAQHALLFTGINLGWVELDKRQCWMLNPKRFLGKSRLTIQELLHCQGAICRLTGQWVGYCKPKSSAHLISEQTCNVFSII